MAKIEITHLVTESRNPKTMNLDDMSIHQFLEIMNEEDASVPLKVKEVLPQIEKAVEKIIYALKNGGKLYYVGSGTSGRLGVLDAVECPPTFGTTDEVQGIIAGGDSAFVKAKEGAEDNEEGGYHDIYNANITADDIVVGIAASGRTPHTIGALKAANEIGAFTISIACNPNSKIGQVAKLAIDMTIGPEVITGSTRLKAGTAQKLVLNMLSTASMVGIGKTYQNLMVDMKPTNEKLVERSKHIIMEATECSYEQASIVFEESHRQTKIAIVMILLDCDEKTARLQLEKHHGFVKNAIIDKQAD
ncbi:MAG: N-acetylmuramic acid 6-phosphate etherase [Beduini sp.]|uniref:N-acetylmuramic acid 6-phosphate etherase n=1 Tax=Beduini sp. TaxID=1922300 RepID=UPI0011CB3052